MSCDLTTTISDIRRDLEGYIIDWNEDTLANNGLMLSIEDIYPESTIVLNRANSLTTMYSMTTEIARIAYAISTLYASTTTVQTAIDNKLTELCNARDTHESNRAAWIAYRDTFLVSDPEYTTANNNASSSETRKNSRQSDYDDLYGDANPIIVSIEEQYNNLLGGVLKSIYTCNKSVGTEIDESFDDDSAFAYVLRTTLKLQRWIQFSSKLETAQKLKSVTYTKQLKDGSGNHSAVVGELSAFEMTDTEVLTTVDYKDAIIEGYGPEMIANILSSYNDIVAQYSFLQALLITETSGTGNKVEYTESTATYTIDDAANGFKTSAWHQQQIDALDILPDPYEAEPSGEEFIPLS